MTPKRKRFYFIFSIFSIFCLIVGTALIVLQDNILFFYTPTEILEKNPNQNKKLRLGGLVQENSVKKKNIKTQFIVTDLKTSITVTYQGILPDLFREGQGVIANGYLKGKTFEATEVLAKHDENYMNPGIKKKLKK